MYNPDTRSFRVFEINLIIHYRTHRGALQVLYFYASMLVERKVHAHSM